jgi:hypothetical protein
MRLMTCGVVALALLAPSHAWAGDPYEDGQPPQQQPAGPPAPQPPGYPPPAPGYGYAQPGYPQPSYPVAQPLVIQPPHVHYEMRPRYGLLVAGVLTFGIPWVMSALGGYAAGNGVIAIPVVGPLAFATSNGPNACNCGLDNSGGRLEAAFFFFDTLVQTAGVAMALVGMLTKQRVAVTDRVAILPAPLPAGGGLSAVGRF